MSFLATLHSLALFWRPVAPDDESGGWEPPLDLYETANDVVIELELPGTRPRDVRLVSTAEGLLVEGITGESVRPDAATVLRFLRVERASGAFRRLIPLPPTVDRDRASARFRNGLLTIRIPKVAE